MTLNLFMNDFTIYIWQENFQCNVYLLFIYKKLKQINGWDKSFV
jgi:hypothetical protein